MLERENKDRQGAFALALFMGLSFIGMSLIVSQQWLELSQFYQEGEIVSATVLACQRSQAICSLDYEYFVPTPRGSVERYTGRVYSCSPCSVGESFAVWYLPNAPQQSTLWQLGDFPYFFIMAISAFHVALSALLNGLGSSLQKLWHGSLSLRNSEIFGKRKIWSVGSLFMIWLLCSFPGWWWGYLLDKFLIDIKEQQKFLPIVVPLISLLLFSSTFGITFGLLFGEMKHGPIFTWIKLASLLFWVLSLLLDIQSAILAYWLAEVIWLWGRHPYWWRFWCAAYSSFIGIWYIAYSIGNEEGKSDQQIIKITLQTLWK